ncbi:MAG: amidohydrolase family protein [Pseudonocardiaceae bacterium]
MLGGPFGARIERGAVLIDNEKIVKIGTRDDLATQAEEIVELAFPAGTIIPGFINAHVHLAFDPGPRRLERLTDNRAPAEIVLAMAGHAHELLNSGVTTVRDLGDRGGLAVTLRDAIAAGELAGPRVLAATAPITPPGGHCWFLGGEVDNAGDIRARVLSNAAAGADVIKVMASGGSLTPGGAAMWEPQFSTDQLKVITTEAHQVGLPVAAHAHGLDSIRACIEAGVDTIEHCTLMVGKGRFHFDEALGDQLATSEIPVCVANSADWRALAGGVGETQAKVAVSRLRWLADRGVRLITGTDAGMGPFDNFPIFLQRLAEWKFTPEQIIQMATADTAAAIGLAATTGQLLPGLAADLLVLAGDPLRELATLGRHELVVARGRPHRPTAIGGTAPSLRVGLTNGR